MLDLYKSNGATRLFIFILPYQNGYLLKNKNNIIDSKFKECIIIEQAPLQILKITFSIQYTAVAYRH